MFGGPPQRIAFCGCFIIIESVRKYLPQVKVNAHTTILDTTSRTTLTQTFVNPNKDKALDQIKYVFPIYDGVSVVGFTCTVGDRVIKGVVKEREKAKQVYDEATARGEMAGLFEQSLEAADVFTTTIGNVPAGEKIVVDITYLGELKHDAEVDGVRFTIPDHIVPRYGSADSLSSTWTIDEGFTITVDAEMPEGSAIKSIQSPSHPISVNIGTTSKEPSADPSLRKASATLSRSAANLDADFIVQVVATKMGEPAAFVETHPTIPNQRAIMATLVPKFKLPAEKPEIVFLCDRSGSMSSTIPDLVAALRIFLKSLPVGVKFNICSFGSKFDFLWSKSKTYSQESLDKAMRHVEKFSANYGGTQMVEPLKATFDRRYKDLNLEVFLLTDGAIWDQEKLFDLINERVAESRGAIRVFSLGVGSGASTALIEGAARAGNGFSQTVGDNEKMDKKVVRMLKGSLFPHITDYTLEIKYEKAESKDADDDDFEVIEKVMDAMSIRTLVEKEDDENKVEEKPKKKISLFDKNADDDDDTQMADAPVAVDNKYDHLPAVTPPRYLQTPSSIPPLFPFNRTTVYVLLSDDTPTQKPKSVILRGTSNHGPLELEIPIVNLTEKSTTIHQLAARKEVKELEEGRGWISLAKDDAGKLLKEKYESQFSDMVEREAVRLGVGFQVGGKWCSFVAAEETENVSSDGPAPPGGGGPMVQQESISFGSAKPMARLSSRSDNRDSNKAGIVPQSTGGLFGNTQSPPSGSGLFGSASPASPSVLPPPPPPSGVQKFAYDKADSSDDGPIGEISQMLAGSTEKSAAAPNSASTIDTSDPLQALTSLQTFVGSWTWSETLEKILGVTSAAASKLSLPNAAANHADRNTILATMCAVVYFKKNLKAEKDVWEMLVDKAESWLEDQLGEGVEDLEKAVEGLF
ncbi:von Willebrand factor type A domain-containing protein [Dactylonectria macrodidyma]|uniref:von Willebrand factor type A domain-containing protein n=1 Tax=Dactylonectria macrodidyma TaxID=307937 RepID=A0A9P9DVU0_9HYPO|nr:von Willebrand factor type A domain-containing protein [Dactylonectria macrodidyma]